MNPDPLYVDDEPWPLYPEPAYRIATAWQSPRYWLIAALVAVLALIAWRTQKP